MPANSNDEESLPLNAEATHILEECRMVLPGIQALFGFQLIAVFNRTFFELISRDERCVHLGAIAASATAIALVMAPAAMHRIGEPDSVSRSFVEYSSRLLAVGMLPLTLGICGDFYLIARIVTGSVTLAIALAVALAGVFAVFWMLIPFAHRRHRRATTRLHR